MILALIILAALFLFDCLIVYACAKAECVTAYHGEWLIECQNRCRCSRCGFGRNTDTQIGWNYCPNCGAKMDGDKDG